MKFRTEITPPKEMFSIAHRDKIMMIGSCFVENISSRMQEAGFQLDINPFGILYNPISISNALYDLLNRESYSEADLFSHNGIYRSFSHHGRFSGIEKETVLQEINLQLKTSKEFLKKASYLIITFGTAKVYRLLSSGEVVSNCHKLAADRFSHELLSVTSIQNVWTQCLHQLQEINPRLKVIFTVSPIRHWKDGIHENQLSKSVLFVALNQILTDVSDTYYFPSYEIMMDDLRDYRFYKEDMVHPNSQAIDYIWQKFGNTYFSDATQSLIKEWESIQQAFNHKPFNPGSEEHRHFLQKAQARKTQFLQNHPEFK